MINSRSVSTNTDTRLAVEPGVIFFVRANRFFCERTADNGSMLSTMLGVVDRVASLHLRRIFGFHSARTHSERPPSATSAGLSRLLLLQVDSQVLQPPGRHFLSEARRFRT